MERYIPPSGGNCSRSMSRLTLYSGSGCALSIAPYSRLRISLTPYLSNSSQHLMLMERRRAVLRSVEDKWKRTLAKSTNWTSNVDGLETVNDRGAICVHMTYFRHFSVRVV